MLIYNEYQTELLHQISIFCHIQLQTGLLYNVGRSGRYRMVLGLQLPMQCVLITTKVVSSNLAHGEVYSIQQFVIKFVSDLRQVDDFLRVLLFPPPIKLTRNHITEILLKMVLNTIALTQ
jgi:hypothetical protein